MRDIMLKILFVSIIVFVVFTAGRMFETTSPSAASYWLQMNSVGTVNNNSVLEVQWQQGAVYSPKYWESIAILAPHYEHVRLVSP